MTTQSPEFGGCRWPVDAACFDDEWSSLSTEVQDRALALASSTLERLVGGRVAACPLTVRPCRPHAFSAHLGQVFWNGGFQPMNWNGTWTNVCWGPGMGCDTFCEVKLPAPVGRVDQVKVDGLVVDPALYRVDGNILVYTGEGECLWPRSQDLRLPDTEPGTFSVTYLNAYPVDSQGAYAVALLAMEFAYACAGKKCRLPDGVTTIARQGITMEISTGAFPGGVTGLREVDTYIALWNPGGLQRQSTVWSPGSQTRITTGGNA